MELIVGQKVYLKPVGNNARHIKNSPIINHIEEYEIKKVGRKYFEVWKDGFERSAIKFNKDSLRQETEYTADWELYFSKQEILDEKESEDLVWEIRKVLNQYGKCDLPLDKLRRIADIINE